MARRSKAAGADPLADLATKLEILEREMAVQRRALERLKEMSRPARETPREPQLTIARKSA